MVRGCQKKIIYLKNTQSNMFEEAYFVIKDNLFYEKDREGDMIDEANRILKESFNIEESESFARKTLQFLKKYSISFLSGLLLGIIITILI